MSQNLAKVEAFKPDPLPLEECLSELAKYGNPRVSKLSSGWNSRIEVFVTGKGVEFDVKSDFGMADPVAAANQCYKRLHCALDKIKQGEK